ncbi:hypothetical protein [Methylobacterium sp. SyP6R]|uniref:hypothetical protein n=1 Tax=Methylobacterium sp. SyP6R TaxID=2718876 RepID=UPI001F3C36AC|nr:hypothetical protein [Methylobacterium sp. SyP6R]MCF4130164.1 hypothetical protein [Methylobacterium sp. SyP6R]
MSLDGSLRDPEIAGDEAGLLLEDTLLPAARDQIQERRACAGRHELANERVKRVPADVADTDDPGDPGAIPRRRASTTPLHALVIKARGDPVEHSADRTPDDGDTFALEGADLVLGAASGLKLLIKRLTPEIVSPRFFRKLVQQPKQLWLEGLWDEHCVRSKDGLIVLNASGAGSSFDSKHFP